MNPRWTDDERAKVGAWLALHGIDWSTVPMNSDFEYRTNPDRWTIQQLDETNIPHAVTFAQRHPWPLATTDAGRIAAWIEHRVRDEVHPCIRPGCPDRAMVAYYVDEPMRLAGRDLARGQFVDLCPRDDRALRLAASDALALGFGGPFDRIAQWLAADGSGLDQNPLNRFREWTS